MRTIDTSKICVNCRGTKEVKGKKCDTCNGTGQVDQYAHVAKRPAPPDGEVESIADRIMRPHMPSAKLERQSIASAWADYERTVLDPIGAGQVQRREMRRAWYTGVAWLMDAITVTMDDTTPEATEQDLEYLDSVQTELEEFAAKMKRGDA